MEHLAYFLSAYFHEDWDYRHPTWEEVVDKSLTDDPAATRPVIDEIDALLAGTTDQELSEALARMGCAYDPAEGDRTWLLALRDRLAAGDHR